MALQNLRSSTPSKRPDASSMSDGQIALNTAAASAGLFFKDSNGDLVKTGPVHIGTTAPNSTPATGGSTGNSKGEAWLDTSNSNYVLKIYDGTAWQSVEIAPGSARQLLQTNAAGTDVEFTSNVDVPGTLDVTGATTLDSTASVAGLLSANGKVSFTAGTEALPAIYSGSDTNTGIYSPGADQFAISTAGTSRLYIAADGDVGIGTSNPSADLHVSRNGAEGLEITPTISSVYLQTYNRSTSSFVETRSIASQFRWDLGATEAMRIDSNGKVGIGTSSPDAKLKIQAGNSDNPASSFAIRQNNAADTAQTTFSIESSPTDGVSRLISSATSTPQLAFYTGGNERLRIDSSGNVGIGTASPSSYPGKLVIAGDGTVCEHEFNSRVSSSLTNNSRGFMQFTDGSEQLHIYSPNGGDNVWEVGAVERLRVGSTGNVGIGTSAPDTQFDVRGNARIGAKDGSDAELQIGSGATGNRNAYVDFVGDTTYTDYGLRLIRQNGGANTISELNHRGTGALNLVTQDAAPLGFLTSGSERMRIDSIGNVGIGTSAPIVDLNVRTNVNGSEGGNLCIQNTGSGLNTSVALYLTPNNGGGNDLQRTAAIKSRQDIAGNYANLEFYTSPSSTPAERMRVSSLGELFVGLTSGGSAAFKAGTVKAKAYNTKPGANGALTGNVFNIEWTSPNAKIWIDTTLIGTIATASDYRVKDNIVPITSDCIDRVKQLRPVQFEYTDYAVFSADGVTREGFIAHEVQEVIPSGAEGVKDDPDQLQSLKLDAILSVTVKALQEAIAKIETLEQRLSDAGL
jgi:hypothetical protein